MATHEAVGAVGLTLQRLLQDRLEHPNGSGAAVPVTLGHPGPERDPEGATEAPRVNLFLYQVSENPFLKNQDLAGTGHPGGYGHPPLSLDLRFLLTVFGSTVNGEFFDETPAHLLLGSAMRVLHDHAELTPTLVSVRQPAGSPLLDPPLRDEHERVKLTLRPLGLEDLANIWTALELSYRLSVAYEANVVQIESARPRHYPRPVQEPPDAGPHVVLTTLRRPDLTGIGVRRAGDAPGTERTTPYARIGDVLVLRGQNLGGGGLVVRLGDLERAPDLVDLDGSRLEITVPEALAVPGVIPVEVAAAVPALPHVAATSGRAAFVLVPEVAGAGVAGRLLTVTGTRLLSDPTPAQVVVGDVAVDSSRFLPASTGAQLLVPLPDSLPAFPASALVSGPLAPFPDVAGQFELVLSVDGDGPHPATLAGTPVSLEEAAALLEAAIRAAPAPALAGARVAATDRELVVVPAGLSGTVVVEPGDLADALALAPPTGTGRQTYLSGTLGRFVGLSSAAPQVDVTIGGVTRRALLGGAPTTPAGAATALEAAIRAADPGAAFAQCRVAVLGDQVCVLPGADVDVAFRAAAAVDETTVVELALAADYLVRVRVGGVESIDERMVGLPA